MSGSLAIRDRTATSDAEILAIDVRSAAA